MNVTLYQCNDDIRKINKTLKVYNSFACKFINDSNVINPNLLISRNLISDYVNCNYAYIDTLQRYYFINDMTLRANGFTELQLSEDVLMSFRNDINNLQCIIIRQENVYDPYIIDNELITRSNRFFEALAFPNKLFNYSDKTLDSNNIVLTTVGSIVSSNE